MICLYSLVLEKSSSLVRKMRKICADIFSEASPQNCARIVPHKFCTISAHFLMPPHMFCTNFRGPLGTTPRTNFAQFSQTRGMFLKSASVQANHVSILGIALGLLFSVTRLSSVSGVMENRWRFSSSSCDFRVQNPLSSKNILECL